MILIKNVHFSAAEEEWIRVFVEEMGISLARAQEEVIKFKREQLFVFEQRGNKKMVEQLRWELGLIDTRSD